MRIGDAQAGVDVEDMSACLHLGDGVAADAAEVRASISAASFLRPVGLMRSPMRTKGRLGPMMTVLVGEVMIVSRVIGWSPGDFEQWVRGVTAVSIGDDVWDMKMAVSSCGFQVHS